MWNTALWLCRKIAFFFSEIADLIEQQKSAKICGQKIKRQKFGGVKINVYLCREFEQ
jgi:hypothetical protein